MSVSCKSNIGPSFVKVASLYVIDEVIKSNWRPNDITPVSIWLIGVEKKTTQTIKVIRYNPYMKSDGKAIIASVN